MDDTTVELVCRKQNIHMYDNSNIQNSIGLKAYLCKYSRP